MAETATLKVGDEAPDFELPASPTGEKFKLSDYRGKNAVILNFMPAAFSPVCSNQATVIQEKKAEFDAQDAIPVAISSDGAWTLDAWKKQQGITYPVLSDTVATPRGSTAAAYGVILPNRDVANRVVVVVGKDGKVAWIQPVEKIVDIPDYDPVLACSKG